MSDPDEDPEELARARESQIRAAAAWAEVPGEAVFLELPLPVWLALKRYADELGLSPGLALTAFMVHASRKFTQLALALYAQWIREQREGDE